MDAQGAVKTIGLAKVLAGFMAVGDRAIRYQGPNLAGLADPR